jgi:hypothetical protein
MAYTYENTPVLSKVKIGDSVYFVKDADVRAIIDEYGDIVSYNVETTLTDGSNIPTGAAVTAAIKNGVAGVTGAMHFIGVKDSVPTDYDGAAGDLIIVGTKEYVYDGKNFVELGDEAIYLTTASAETNYVQKTFTIAGIDMQDDITVAEIKSALGLKALAYKDSASGSLSDYVTGLTGADYTPAGTIAASVATTATTIESTGAYTPAGSVTGTVTPTGTVAIAADNANGFQITGSVDAPTVTVTPATAQVQHIKSVGTLPSYTAASYTAPSVSETTGSFATAGMTASVEDEVLTFADASTASALTATGFKAGSFTDGTFSAGTLPTLADAQTVVTGITSATASAPTFTGGKISATFTGTSDNISAKFTGTEGSVSVSGSYDKATSASAEFTGTKATITPTLTKGSKTVTVS